MSKVQEKANRRKLLSSYFTTIVSMSLVLFLLGMLGLLLLNAHNLSNYVKENIGFSVYVKEGVKEGAIIRFQKELDRESFIKSTHYITKEEAAEKLQQELGEDFVGFLGYNPLLSSIEVRLKASYTTRDKMSKLKESLLAEHSDMIYEIDFEEDLVREINENMSRISLVILLFSGLLMLVSIALINNTIRLSVYSKRLIIRSMQLVGATDAFIRRPFVRTGIQLGVVSAFGAVVLLSLVIVGLKREFPELINIEQLDVVLWLYGIVFMIGGILAGISYYFAVTKYLRLKADRVYL